MLMTDSHIWHEAHLLSTSNNRFLELKRASSVSFHSCVRACIGSIPRSRDAYRGPHHIAVARVVLVLVALVVIVV